MVCWIQSVSIIKKIHEMLSPPGLPIGTIFLNHISMVHVSEKHFCHCWWNSRTELSELSLAPIREHIYCPYIEGLRLLELCKIYFYAVQLFMYKWYHIKLSYIFLPLFQVNYDMTGCITCQGNLLLMPFGSIGLHQGMLVCSTVSLYNCFHNMLEYNCSWVTYKYRLKEYLLSVNRLPKIPNVSTQTWSLCVCKTHLKWPLPTLMLSIKSHHAPFFNGNTWVKGPISNAWVISHCHLCLCDLCICLFDCSRYVYVHLAINWFDLTW